MSLPSDASVPNETHPSTFDPAGQAALLLTESLIHQLLKKSGLSKSEAAEVVQCAIEAQLDIEGANDAGSSASMSQATGLLRRIEATLAIDAGEGLNVD
jgi:hypothetical protein